VFQSSHVASTPRKKANICDINRHQQKQQMQIESLAEKQINFPEAKTRQRLELGEILECKYWQRNFSFNGKMFDGKGGR